MSDHWMSISNILIFVGLILTAFGIAAAAIDIICCIEIFDSDSQRNGDLYLLYLGYLLVAILVYSCATIFNFNLFHIDSIKAIDKFFGAYNRVAIAAILFSFFDMFAKLLYNWIYPILFLVYCILTLVSLNITWTGANDVKKEKEFYELRQLQLAKAARRFSSLKSDHDSGQECDDHPKFAMTVEDVDVEVNWSENLY